MRVINARNVSEAWDLFKINTPLMARKATPRGLAVVEFPYPVATYYTNPVECVLLDPARDANPFFHLYEAIWLIAGWNDVGRVSRYSSQIKTYSDDHKYFHGGYGARWWYRLHLSQIYKIVRVLQDDPDSRRAVLQMWDARIDLGGSGKDYPCNTHVYFKVRDDKLHMTVCNRSNDAVWGCYGANAVQFSFLQQFVARLLKVEVGPYLQLSDSLHMYTEGKEGAVARRCLEAPHSLMQDYSPESLGVYYTPHDFSREDAIRFTADPTGKVWVSGNTSSMWLRTVAYPVLRMHQVYKEKGPYCALAEYYTDCREAWFVAARAWLLRRAEKRGVVGGEGER